MGLLDSVIRKALAGKLEGYGFDWVEVHSVSLAKNENRLHVELMLDGEDAPLAAALDYEVEDEQLHIRAVSTDKRWITEVLQLLVESKGGAVPLPGGVAGMVVKMLT